MSNIIQPPPPEYQTPSSPYDAPSPGSHQPPKKSYGWVWITVGIVGLVSILGCALLAWGASWAFNTYYNSSYRASDMYYSAIKTQDYRTAYSYLGSSLQREYSQQTFTQAAQQQDATLGTVSRFGMTNIPTGDSAYVTLTVTRVNGTTYDVHLELRQEGGAWKVTAFDRI